MDKNQKERLNRMLWGFYQRQSEQVRLEAAIEATEKQLAAVRRSLRDTGGLIPGFGAVSRPGDTRGSGEPSDPTAAAYAEYARAVDDLKGELAGLARRQVRLKLRLSKLLSESTVLEYALARLPEAERHVLEQKYLYRRTNVLVGLALGVDEGTVRYRQRRAMGQLAVWLGERLSS